MSANFQNFVVVVFMLLWVLLYWRRDSVCRRICHFWHFEDKKCVSQ